MPIPGDDAFMSPGLCMGRVGRSYANYRSEHYQLIFTEMQSITGPCFLIAAMHYKAKIDHLSGKIDPYTTLFIRRHTFCMRNL